MGGRSGSGKSAADWLLHEPGIGSSARSATGSGASRHGSKSPHQAQDAGLPIEPAFGKNGYRPIEETLPEAGLRYSNGDASMGGHIARRRLQKGSRQVLPAWYALFPLPLRMPTLNFRMTAAILGFHDSNLRKVILRERSGLPLQGTISG
jgi:hypothetical protein